MKHALVSLGLIVLAVSSLASDDGALEIKITGFENDKGQAIVMVYDSPEGFPRDHAKAWRKSKVQISDRAATIRFDAAPAGRYAVLAIHDINSNGKMDKNFIGMPKEPVGLSNYPKISRPNFDKASFELKSGETVKQSIRVGRPRR